MNIWLVECWYDKDVQVVSAHRTEAGAEAEADKRQAKCKYPWEHYQVSDPLPLED